MNTKELKILLKEVKEGKYSIEEAAAKLKYFPVNDLGHTKIDMHREIRTGYPEIIYCAGKTIAQVRDIVKAMDDGETNILATRATKEMYEAVEKTIPDAEYHEIARAILVHRNKPEQTKTYISIVTAGTSDMPVAEEAVLTAEVFGNKVKRFYDVGVAGIHRLHHNIEEIGKARVIVVVAGMEGALPSVVGGLVDVPVIAVPTSIGYGANFSGLSALLGMLTSCASGISVVNIDNGFGAGYMAGMINKL